MPAPLRGAVLARVSGLPVRLWLVAANPRLAGAVHDVEEMSRAHHARTVVLAESIGRELVPHLGLSARERALALRVRRALHNGVPVAGADITAVVDVARRVGARDDLVRDLLDAAARQVELAEAERAVDGSLAAERERLLRGSWDEVTGSVPARRALRHDNPAAYHDIERRVCRGDQWTGKRLRRESEYLWRMIERGTTKATPRGWFGHVGLVDVDIRGRADEPNLVLGSDVTAYAVDSVYVRRHRADATDDPDLWSDPSVRVAVTPLHRMDEQHLWVWTGNPERTGRLGPAELVEVRLRRTSALDALVSGLAGRARPVADAVDCLLPVAGTAATARAFLRHLEGRGVLTLTSPPVTRRFPGRYATESPAALDGQVDGEPARSGDRTFVDVYREVLSPIESHWYRRVERLVAQACRIDALIEADQHDQHDAPAGLTSRPRPVLDLVFDELRTPPEHDQRPAPHGWPPPRHPDSGYAALVDRLGSVPVTRVADITPTLLDALGAPAATVDWPVDTIVRPIAGDTGPIVALDCVAPAGVLDSRFADMLARSGRGAPGLASYREWLRRIEEETGGLFVELLLPPVSAVAANAVRRPVYTRAWTGDPDPRPYHGASPPEYRYIPLSDVTLHLCDGEVVAQAAGRRIWPMYHATRTPQQPWKALYRWLMRASPQRRYSPGSLSTAGDLLARHGWAPRVTVDASLVLIPASWRVARAGLWDNGAPVLAKARALDRLRHRLGLPRWVFVVGAPGGALACDLDSARAVGTVERVVEEAPDGVIVIEEMLPDPDHFVAADGRHPVPDRFATELLLRLPSGTDTDGGGGRP